MVMRYLSNDVRHWRESEFNLLNLLIYDFEEPEKEEQMGHDSEKLYGGEDLFLD